eukprot:TRINITY_DN1159_c0_g2_i2.p1 TRINITY_DN1159_c0_g2~~TRINITY_DN1159_c0_g2_i2.p1  ORF type:complete len:510 (-),score=47.68 TRINITY_DN1159_c0_g2_i2:129-1658(-)
MDSQAHQLHMFFLPFMAPGHMIPMIDMAKSFAERGVKVTIITTTSIASHIEKTIERASESCAQIELCILRFPSKEVGLPEGLDNVNSVPSPEFLPLFFKAIDLLQEPVEQLLRDHHPNCIVSDMFIPWTVDAADKFGIPTLFFSGSGYFSRCVSEILYRYKPHENVATDTEPFIIPGLPHPIKITKAELPNSVKSADGFKSIMDRSRRAEMKSYGVVMNSFYELEPAYADHYVKELKKKSWHIGPVSLCNRINIDKAERGKKASIDQADCLKWLDTKNPSSVIYVCFGSVSKFTTEQLCELALGLEASNRDFIWVVRDGMIKMENEKEWLPQGFEERLNGKGLIIRGWAPQILILDHPSIGGFMTHCGWNSILESVSAGVPMITWPLFAEQFINEKLITQVLETGISVGAGVWAVWEEKVLVPREAVEKAVGELMGGGEEVEGMWNRARELREMAKRSVEKGGSSYMDMGLLIEELAMCREKGEERQHSNESLAGKGCVVGEAMMPLEG